LKLKPACGFGSFLVFDEKFIMMKSLIRLFLCLAVWQVGFAQIEWARAYGGE